MGDGRLFLEDLYLLHPAAYDLGADFVFQYLDFWQFGHFPI
jgi:hypothetical protein